jgi:3-oxoacyl-[acyl-carrier protein] reductase
MVANFKNKVVLVSGAGKGIGKETALAFARSGAAVAFFARDKQGVQEVEKEIKRIGGRVLASTFDITKFNQMDDYLKDVKTKFEKIDILVNNVGVGLVKRFFQTSEADFDLVFSTNLKGPFFLTQRVIKEMKAGSSIIFITSIHAEQPSLDPTYDASKAAINSLVKNLALDLAPKGIRVNAIAPGHIDSKKTKEPRVRGDVPLGKKAGLPQDVASACLFLADSEKARYITGAILPVTGGLHIPIAKDIKF